MPEIVLRDLFDKEASDEVLEYRARILIKEGVTGKRLITAITSYAMPGIAQHMNRLLPLVSKVCSESTQEEKT